MSATAHTTAPPPSLTGATVPITLEPEELEALAAWLDEQAPGGTPVLVLSYYTHGPAVGTWSRNLKAVLPESGNGLSISTYDRFLPPFTDTRMHYTVFSADARYRLEPDQKWLQVFDGGRAMIYFFAGAIMKYPPVEGLSTIEFTPPTLQQVDELSVHGFADQQITPGETMLALRFAGTRDNTAQGWICHTCSTGSSGMALLFNGKHGCMIGEVDAALLTMDLQAVAPEEMIGTALPGVMGVMRDPAGTWVAMRNSHGETFMFFRLKCSLPPADLA